MSIDASLIACTIGTQGSLAHHGFTNDKGRTLLLLLSCCEGFTNLSYVVAINLDDIPSPYFISVFSVITTPHSVESWISLES